MLFKKQHKTKHTKPNQHDLEYFLNSTKDILSVLSQCVNLVYIGHYSVTEGQSYFQKEVGTDGFVESGDCEIQSGKKSKQVHI